MMSEAGVEGYYTNHSLQVTAVSRLFQNDVDDKLVIDLLLYRATKEKLKSNFWKFRKLYKAKKRKKAQ